MIERLSIHGFRGFDGLTLEPLGRINVLIGPTNSGKTNFLEAVYLFCSNGDPGLLPQVLKLRRIDEPKGLPTPEWQRCLNWFWSSGDPSGICRIEGSWNRRQREILLTAHEHDELMVMAEPAHGSVTKAESNIGAKTLATYTIQTKSGSDDYRGELDVLTDGIKLRSERIPNLPGRFCSIFEQGSRQMAPAWSQTEELGQQQEVLKLIKSLDSEVENIRLVADAAGTASLVLVHSRLGTIPLEFQGTGLGKALSLACSINQVKNGILIMDEFDSSLHVGIQARLVSFLFDAAVKLNVQLFIATHSLETIDTILQYEAAAADLYETADEHMRFLRFSPLGDSRPVQNLTANDAGVLRDEIRLDVRR